MITNDILGGLLEPGRITMLFQPIVANAPEGQKLFALEALARGPRGTNMERPDLMFAYARRKNREVVLDQCCLEIALTAAAVLPGEPVITLNVHAATLTTIPGFADWLGTRSARVGIDPSRLIIEIVEHGGPLGPTDLGEALSALREAGTRIAVDDIGWGDANYRMLIDCRPEYLKVDGYVVRGCTSDPYRRAILRGTVGLAASSNGFVIAEGVEC